MVIFHSYVKSPEGRLPGGFYMVLCISMPFSLTGCHNHLLFVSFFEAWHSAAARGAFMLWLGWNGAFGWFCWCGQGILKPGSPRSSSMFAISGLGLDKAFGWRKKTIEDLPKRRKEEREGAVNPCQVSQMMEECSSKTCLIYLYLEHDVSNVGHSEVLCAQSNSFFAFCSEQRFPRWSPTLVGKTRPIHINL